MIPAPNISSSRDQRSRLQRKFFQAIDRLDDVLFCRAWVDRAKAKRSHAFERRGSEKGESIPEHRFDESGLKCIVFPETERDDCHFGGRKNLATAPRS